MVKEFREWTARVERLEAEARRWRLLAVVLFCGLGLVMFLGATTLQIPEEVKAKRFTLTDDQGRALAVLGTTVLAGQPQHGLTVYRSSNPAQAPLSAVVRDDGFPSITLTDPHPTTDLPSGSSMILTIGNNGYPGRSNDWEDDLDS